MPDPEDGKSPTIVKPTAPKVAQDADQADPGQVEALKAEQREAKTGKYGSAKVNAHKPGSEENKDKTHWIEIVLVDDDGDPVPNAAVEIEVPGGDIASGATDGEGKFKVTNIDAGSCKIKFTQLDQEAWEPA